MIAADSELNVGPFGGGPGSDSGIPRYVTGERESPVGDCLFPRYISENFLFIPDRVITNSLGYCSVGLD